MNEHHLDTEPGAATVPCYSTLPDGLQRGDIERLLMNVSSQIGLSDSDLKTLLICMATTRPSDWTTTTVEPVCFMKQTNIARETGKSARAVRRAETRLEAAGLIEKQVAANGSRCRLVLVDGGEFRQGLSFTPLIERVPALLRLQARLKAENQREIQLRRMCSALKRNIKQRLMGLQPMHPTHHGLQEVAQEFLKWPSRYDGFRSLDELERHFEKVRRVSDRADDIARVLLNTTGRTDKCDRPYIQDTIEDCDVICKANEPVRTSSDPHNEPEKNAVVQEMAIPTHEEREGKFLARLTPQRLLTLSSEDMRLYIRQYQGCRDVPVATDFVLASIARSSDLEIHKSAYEDAIDKMGDMRTALCILIIDRNRHHPDTPIRNPGGVLRTMTARFETGTLNLVGSLMGISAREP